MSVKFVRMSPEEIFRTEYELGLTYNYLMNFGCCCEVCLGLWLQLAEKFKIIQQEKKKLGL
jgi:hypothetical protein